MGNDKSIRIIRVRRLMHPFDLWERQIIKGFLQYGSLWGDTLGRYGSTFNRPREWKCAMALACCRWRQLRSSVRRLEVNASVEDVERISRGHEHHFGCINF